MIKLWQICFGDEKEFIESFFEHFRDRIKVGIHCEDEKIVSALYCLPAELVFEKKRISVWYIYAVATLPEFRRRGYAGKLIDEVKMLDDGKQALFLTPSNEKNSKFYESLGFSDGFYNFTFDFEKTESKKTISLKKRTDENLFLFREKYLGKYPYVSWDEKHLAFAFEINTLIVFESGKAAGYLHFEKETGNITIDEICVEEKIFEDVLNEACNLFGTKKLTVCAQNGEKSCKINKGMIYCKFGSMEKDFTKNQFYLGVNLE